jgi:TRAP-type C4-dicarboxylate transport system permease small subunit
MNSVQILTRICVFLFFCVVAWSYYQIVMNDVDEAEEELKKHYWVRATVQTIALAGLFYKLSQYVEKKFLPKPSK